MAAVAPSSHGTKISRSSDVADARPPLAKLDLCVKEPSTKSENTTLTTLKFADDDERSKKKVRSLANSPKAYKPAEIKTDTKQKDSLVRCISVSSGLKWNFSLLFYAIKRKRSAKAAEPTIAVIQTTKIKTVESKAESKGEKSQAATSTRLSELDRMTLTAAKRAMFAAVSSKGNSAKTRTALNFLLDLIQECGNEGVVNSIASGTSYMAVLYDSTSPDAGVA
ncbi:uncharacterized protein FFMR_08452 [Fusarium fujikuroi]|nr:uncharacterized protein FFMR_08452 [Fusarium fujikuroi]SCV28796.1 uncharacterized protein FFB14_02014 [Fusarium fujikuroi]